MKLISEKRKIPVNGCEMKIIILRPERRNEKLPAVLWIHGGGYITGMASMVYFNMGKDIVKKCGAVVVSPEYRLSGEAPYPAALEDCYAALLYLKEHAEELGVCRDRILVGGESAGGGLAAALCMYARDKKEVNICFQLPLYPMIDCEDTESSKNNHAHIWNTRRNHYGWKKYLANIDRTKGVPVYASPSRATDYSNLPPAYTFVCDGEPFYSETIAYIENLRKAGIEAEVDVYHGNTHAFDMMCPWLRISRRAKKKFIEQVRKNIYKGTCKNYQK